MQAELRFQFDETEKNIQIVPKKGKVTQISFDLDNF